VVVAAVEAGFSGLKVVVWIPAFPPPVLDGDRGLSDRVDAEQVCFKRETSMLFRST